jgi:hypothetical protein
MTMQAHTIDTDQEAPGRHATVPPLDTRDFLWIGTGTAPGDVELERAVQVLSAVPLAGAAGWSVHGHPWSTHPRRLRTAVVRPTGEWSMASLRGVREVDLLSGIVLARRCHLERLDVSIEHIADSPEGVTRLSHAMRRAGFRLLYMNGHHT